MRVTPTPINSIQFSLGHNVSESLRMKIIEGKFVDLALLLKNSNIEDTVSERVLVVGNDGQMVSKSRSAVKITSIEKWTDAFLIYVSVFTSVHVSKFQDMLKYMHDVRTGADRSAGWKLYDEQFRLKIAMDPAKSWASVDSELWVMYMVGGQQNSSASGAYNGNKCYNFQGFCFKKQCVYDHSCIKCGQGHCMINCPMSIHVSNRQSFFSPRQASRSGHQQGFRPQGANFTRPSRFSTPRFMGPRSHPN